MTRSNSPLRVLIGALASRISTTRSTCGASDLILCKATRWCPWKLASVTLYFGNSKRGLKLAIISAGDTLGFICICMLVGDQGGKKEVFKHLG